MLPSLASLDAKRSPAFLDRQEERGVIFLLLPDPRKLVGLLGRRGNADKAISSEGKSLKIPFQTVPVRSRRSTGPKDLEKISSESLSKMRITQLKLYHLSLEDAVN